MAATSTRVILGISINIEDAEASSKAAATIYNALFAFDLATAIIERTRLATHNKTEAAPPALNINPKLPLVLDIRSLPNVISKVFTFYTLSISKESVGTKYMQNAISESTSAPSATHL